MSGDQAGTLSVHDTPAARDELIQTAYLELKRLAISFLRRERSDHTLQPTALVHEAYLRLAEQDKIVWQSREHFVGVAATMMRRILVNHAVSKKRQKRGGAALTIPLTEIDLPSNEINFDLVSLDEALVKLEREHPQESSVVELKFFGGLSISETANFLDISDTSVERSWRFARVWLLRELSG